MLKNLRIAVLFVSPILGGHELMAVNHLKKLNGKGVKISSFVPSNNEKLIELMQISSLDYKLHNVLHRKVEIIHSFVNAKYLAQSSALLRKISHLFDFIVVVQGDIELGAGLINTAKRLSLDNIVSYIPYTHSFETMGSKFSKVKDVLAKYVYKNCDKYITICNQFSDDLKIKNPNAQVKVLRNFVDRPKDSGTKFTEVSDYASTDVITILMAGRISFRQKGQDTLIQALKMINRSVQIKLNIIGDGPDYDKLVELSSGLKKNVVVTFFGWKKDVWKHARHVDLLVIPSNYEGVPLIMLEALKRNIPIIAPARDGMLDYLDGKSLYPVGGVEYSALADKINEFIDNQSVILKAKY
ncbi:glycosyl transferase family 1 [Rahnella sp. AA]|uniref:glycosyltransferase n=1 Tax=Rahnella sp. AA TaxID=2057180 RepID=UPI000C3497EA|nr:glycosyltransferase [Rahnella sp. AA]PKE32808.1 glycosyl transferase family 1 [Rahnella sp. AA]